MRNMPSAGTLTVNSIQGVTTSGPAQIDPPYEPNHPERPSVIRPGDVWPLDPSVTGGTTAKLAALRILLTALGVTASPTRPWVQTRPQEYARMGDFPFYWDGTKWQAATVA